MQNLVVTNIALQHSFALSYESRRIIWVSLYSLQTFYLRSTSCGLNLTDFIAEILKGLRGNFLNSSFFPSNFHEIDTVSRPVQSLEKFLEKDP